MLSLPAPLLIIVEIRIIFKVVGASMLPSTTVRVAPSAAAPPKSDLQTALLQQADRIVALLGSAAEVAVIIDLQEAIGIRPVRVGDDLFKNRVFDAVDDTTWPGSEYCSS